MPDVHAKLSASAAHRWLNCPPSVHLSENIPDTPSAYAAEGTLAHSLAELKVRKKFEKMKPSEYNAALKKIQTDTLYAPEMDSHTDTYLDNILSVAHSYNKVKPYVVVEKRLDYSFIAPGGFGTCDCVMLCKNDLHIFDFKYGKGVPVSAENNPQLRLYALGALNEYSFLYDIQTVTMHIIQPRLDSISSELLSVDELTAWGESIKPIAQAADKGEGELKCGDWCKFCKVNATCRARAEYFLATEETAKIPPELLSSTELGDVLSRVRAMKNYIEDIEAYALNEVLSGRTVDGWKAVEGTSKRVITDVDAAFKVLTDNGYDEAVLYERKPIGITALEALLTKKKFTELIGAYVQKPKGKPTLVPTSDKRAEYKSVDVNEIFGGNNNE